MLNAVNENLLFFQRLSLLPGYRGTGLAQKLLGKIYEHVKELKRNGVDVLKLTCSTSVVQRAAQKVYQRDGFEIITQFDFPFYCGLSGASSCVFAKNV